MIATRIRRRRRRRRPPRPPSYRPPRYQTPRTAGLWLDALRRLWALGLADGRIAELLSALSARAIRQLFREGWTIPRAEALAGAIDAQTGQAWTPRMVRHHRRRLDLAARGVGHEALRAELAYRRRRFQSDAGFGHLLPRSDARPGDHRGVCLGRRGVEVLALLYDHGPMTRGELLGKMGLRQLMTRGRSVLARLARAGLVDVRREAGRPPLFALGAAAGLPDRPKKAPPAADVEPADEADFSVLCLDTLCDEFSESL